MTTKMFATTTTTNYYDSKQLLLESDYISLFCNHSATALGELFIYHRTRAMILFGIILYLSQIHSLVNIKEKKYLIKNEIPEFRSNF